ncbi:MAG: acyl carrier protein [Deltaproteobacteria bacterium]|nr:acyl carrier protein [Deltaproteobacteria bacterium]
MVAQDSLRKELREFIVETFLFGDESETFEDNDSFMQKGIIDSTGVLELTSFLEEKYGVKVEDEELIPANLDSIENLIGFIGRKKD